MILIIGLIFTGINGSAIIPENKTITYTLKRRPINSLPSKTIIL